MKTVRVELGKNSYDIHIGNNLNKTIEKFFLQGKFSHIALLVSDSNVGPLYGDKIKRVLEKAGFCVVMFFIKAGESSKSWDVAKQLYTEAIKSGLDRKSPIVALGGGVVGDITGFIAATYMRGVPFVQIPTSLLAYVDSSVGGKVAINHSMGKNLIGAFYQPEAVFIDLDMIKTMPNREISTGLAEVIKYGLIYDKEFFAYIESHVKEIFALNNEVLTYITAKSCEIKAAVVSKDEKEMGLRAILNFGHTIGHAIERETKYDVYNHGEAIAIGMVGVSIISRELGLLDPTVVQKIHHILEICHLPQTCHACTEDGIYRDLFHDKKTIGKKINWVLLDEIGKVHLSDNVSELIVRKAIKSILA
ncbi:3-dehydroquinate synthase [Pectinatus frisingensis]|uniref:3-dehydroquinate synthase n=1 Tax=Pectinatus frisingensis TaxID=865 RepID=UPI0015F49867|nr:3-dehydroquinate synthase [Pectinatus frisingensis]